MARLLLASFQKKFELLWLRAPPAPANTTEPVVKVETVRPANVPVAAEMPPERLIFAPLSKSVRVVVAAERPPISERPAKVGVEVVSTDWFTLAPVTLPVKVAPVPESDPVSVVVAAERAPEKVPVAAEIPPVRFIPAKVGLEVVCVD